MTEYTVHFQKGSRTGARSLRMETVEADNPKAAVNAARMLFPDWRERGYRMIRIDHFEDHSIVQDA